MTLSTADPLPPLQPPPAHPRLAVSRTRRPAWVVAVAEQVGGVLTPIGSAGMKAMSILLGEADAYLHSGPMKEWDSAAPAAVAAKAGLHVSDLEGQPLVFNKPTRLTEQLLICHPSLRESCSRRTTSRRSAAGSARRSGRPQTRPTRPSCRS